MSTRLVFVALVLTLVFTVQANAQGVEQAKAPTLLRSAKYTYVAGAAMDIASSLICLHYGHQEANPFVAWADDQPKMFTTVAVVSTVAQYAIWNKVAKTHPTLAVIGFIGVGVLRGYVASRNMRIMVEYGDQR